LHISSKRFEELAFSVAEEILGQLTPELRAEAETVLMEIAEQSPPREGGEVLLGLYEGVPLVHRTPDSAPLVPDRITLFSRSLASDARTEAELRAGIRRTLIHELGHFFGFDEWELEDRGWG
jgi:predicted Zn-dependent protease with MMP-like domain